MLEKRYQILDLLGQGGMGAVYRAYDRLTGQYVALKRVARSSDVFSTAAPTEDHELRLALAQEFRVLASLRHPNIVSVLDYGFDVDRQPYFTMELLENATPIDDAARELPRDQQIHLLAQVLQALLYLHRRGVLHRDLKPNNVLVMQQTVKVVDFGLALFDDTDDMAMGTLPYMPPEVLYGKRPDERADLYSFGLLAYVIMLGYHPFEDENRHQVLNNIMMKQPDLRFLETDLQPILRRLLQKEPQDRFPNAALVITALRGALNIPLSTESAATRESFLKAARLVGREAERDRLNAALSNALSGYGSVCLVGGESGIGKSRLLDEVRTSALVRGAQVIRGETVSEGANPYSLWREPLRYLALITQPDGLAASTLKAIIPDIATLIGKPVEDAPSLDPEAEQTRLLGVIESLLGQLTQPLMILLEDLHFAGQESLNLLDRLGRITTRLPLLVIGTFRDDERPTLTRELPNTSLIKLERLPRSEIGTLAEAMIGEQGRSSALIDMLERETQGNLFFMVEVVRALAEEAGDLAHVAEVDLQRRVLTGGVEQVVRRRLNRVPAEAQPLLRIAALAGRQVSLPLLQYLAPDIDINQWVNQCAEFVLTPQEDDWIFAHDKLREVLLHEVEAEAPSMHRKIAEGISAIADPKETAAQLAYHWAQAGDRAQEAHYSALAGERAYRNGAWSEASKLLGRALELRSEITFTPLRQAQLLRLQADASYRNGNLVDARRLLREAADVLGWPLPDSPSALTARLTREAGRQAGHRIMPLLRRSARERDWLLETHRIALLEAEIAFLRNETLPMLVNGIGALNQAEAAGISPELARGSANMCYAVGNVGQLKFARIYKNQARRVAEQIGDPSVLEFALRRTSLFDIGLGNWDDAEAALQQSLGYAEALGDLQAREESLDFLGSLTYYHAQYERSRDLYHEVYTSATRTENLVHQAWGWLGQAQSDLRLGDLERAAERLQRALNLLEDRGVTDLITLIQAYGLLALTQLMRGRSEAALLLVQQGATRVGNSEPTGFALLEGYAGAAEVLLLLMLEEGASERRRQGAEEALRRLQALAKPIPIARPRAATLTGLFHHLSGKAALARQSFQLAISTAEKLDMPFELGFAYYHAGRLLPLGDPQRGAHLSAAAAIFARLGCRFHLEQTKRVLDQEVELN